MLEMSRKMLKMSNCVERFFLTNYSSDVNIFIEFKFTKIKSKIFFEKIQNEFNKREVRVNVCLNLLKLVLLMH